jgi:ribosomal protein S18 acetylase RimI-like enzyme
MDAAILAARAADVPLLVALMDEFHAESGYRLDAPAARAALEQLVGDASLGRVWLIAGDGAGDEAAGYVAVSFGFSLGFFGRDALIADLFLRPAFRGRGFGRRALEAVEAACAALGVRALHVETGSDNAAAQALYRRVGLRRTGRDLLSKRIGGAGS